VLRPNVLYQYFNGSIIKKIYRHSEEYAKLYAFTDINLEDIIYNIKGNVVLTFPPTLSMWLYRLRGGEWRPFCRMGLCVTA